MCHDKLRVRADSDRMAALLRWVDIFMINPDKSIPYTRKDAHGMLRERRPGDENID